MLRGIHRASANWLGRIVVGIILGLIAISFAIWGVGDIFRGFGQSTVAKVGQTEIGVEQFRQNFSERVQGLGRTFQRPITPEQARALGVDRQVLAQMIAETAMDERVRAMRLGLPDSEVAKIITEDPSYRGISGQFDHSRFIQTIRQAGYTEQRYLSEQRRLLLRQQLVTALTADIPAPKSLVEAFHRFQNEQRAIEYVLLGRAQAGAIPAPTPEVLAKYFEERKAVFRAPEYRKIALAVLTPNDLLATVEVSDADIKNAYESRKARYVTPERRQVQQILFPNSEQARAAADRLAGGLAFDALAAEPGIKERFTDLGLVTKSGIVDRALADAAFALKAGEVSAPVQGQFGAALLRAVKIESGVTKSFEEVAPEIKKEIALDRAKREMHALRDKVEDERLDGKTLAQAGEKIGLKLRTIEAVDRSGRDPKGNQIADLPAGVDAIAAAFRFDVGTENEALQIPGDGGYVWVDVLEVTPSRERPLEEVKEQVETRWRDDATVVRLKTKTTEMLERLKSGATLADLATANKLKMQIVTGLKRSEGSPGFPLRALGEIFRVPNGAPGVTEGEAATDRIVFRVTDSVVPPYDPNSPEAKRVADVIQRAFSDEVLAQYLARLQSDIGVTINQNALNQATGATTN